MSNAHIGAGLLAEVQELSLDRLLATLRQSLDIPSTAITGVPQLDRLLQVLHKPDTSSTGDLSGSRRQDDAYVDNMYGDSPRRTVQPSTSSRKSQSLPLIEISSSGTRHEATDMCYYLTATAILTGVETGQTGCCTVWLDTEARFSASRLYEVCLRLLGDRQPTLQANERDREVKQALKHVHVFSVQSSKQLLAILRMLPDYLLGSGKTGTNEENTVSLPEHHSAHRRLSLIVLDCATAFYWTDRFDAEIAKLESTASTRTKSINESITSQILTQLKDLQSMFECIVTYTTDRCSISSLQSRYHQRHHTASSTDQQNIPHHNIAPTPPLQPPPDAPVLPALLPWTSAATLSLQLTRIPTTQFASSMSIEDCLRDRDRRAEIVQTNRVKVSLDGVWLDRVVRDTNVRNALRGVNDDGGNGAFVIRCNGHGVFFEK